MFKRGFVLFAIIMLMFQVVGCSSNSEDSNAETSNQEEANKTELLVSAAASLTDAMGDIKEMYEKENSNVELTFNFGGSGKLAQQIEQGAPVDVFISANQNWMDELQQKSMLIDDSRENLISNQLVLIGREDLGIEISSIQDINDVTLDKIAIGEPNSVPAGQYAKQVFENIDLWETIQPKLIFGKDVRQVLTYVESGNVDAGIVYYSDALLVDNVNVLTMISDDLHSPIIYPASILRDSKNIEEAKRFMEFLHEDNAKQIFSKYGFKNE